MTSFRLFIVVLNIMREDLHGFDQLNFTIKPQKLLIGMKKVVDYGFDDFYYNVD